MNSRSSFTDHSDLEQPEDGSRSERRDNRRSWRFHRSSKRSSEQIGLGLASPPLVASDSGAAQSTTSFGSGSHQSNDPASQPLSLDAGIQGNSIPNAEPEKRSLFGKFKAKMAQVVKDDRERAKSPNQSDEPSATSQPLSPTIPNHANGKPPADVFAEHPKEEPLRSPASPLPGAGLPPAIPEEPNSPEAPSAAAEEFKKQLEPEPATTAETTAVPTETPAVAEPSKETTPTDKETTA
jgi:hypothetical protein